MLQEEIKTTDLRPLCNGVQRVTANRAFQDFAVEEVQRCTGFISCSTRFMDYISILQVSMLDLSTSSLMYFEDTVISDSIEYREN